MLYHRSSQVSVTGGLVRRIAHKAAQFGITAAACPGWPPTLRQSPRLSLGPTDGTSADTKKAADHASGVALGSLSATPGYHSACGQIYQPVALGVVRALLL